MASLTEFALAFAIFLAAHVIPARQHLRAGLVAGMGEKTYQLVYSSVSVLLLGWLIIAAARAPLIEVWGRDAWQARLALLLAPIGLWLVIAGAFAANPLSISLRAASTGGRAAVLMLTRHPILWGLALWALAHVLAHGDVVRIVMFGGLGLFALAGTRLIDRRRQSSLGLAEWQDATADTSNIPGLALVLGQARPKLDVALLVAALLSAGITAILLGGWHVTLFGADPLTAAHWLR